MDRSWRSKRIQGVIDRYLGTVVDPTIVTFTSVRMKKEMIAIREEIT